MSPLQLQHKTKPYHCRFLTLSVVDPIYRLCSTGNVPPQQGNWIKGDTAGFAMQMVEAWEFERRVDQGAC